MKNAEEFIKSFTTDKEFAEKVNNVITACKTEEEAAEAVVSFAKTQGFEFDAEEFALAKAKAREISDDDLDKVAGGFGSACALNDSCQWIFNQQATIETEFHQEAIFNKVRDIDK